MKWIRKREKRTVEVENLGAVVNTFKEFADSERYITKEMALNIPTLAACVELIKNTISILPIKLYKEENGTVIEVKNDIRVNLLNDDPKDTLDAFQLKNTLVDDYLFHGNAYIYINKFNGKYQSLNYVDSRQVNINFNIDPIFKDYDIWVNGERYKPYQFIKVLRNSQNGADGRGILQNNQKILSVAYNSLDYENILALTGGNKKGFIKSKSKLAEKAIETLKEQWRKLYSKNSENCVVLNDGLDFHESSSTSIEMQMNENKKTNAIELCKLCNVPPALLEGDGKSNTEEYQKFIKICILPILEAIVTALNRDLLLEKEKGSFYFAFDTKELLKGDIEKRYKAYEIGIKNKILTINEARYEENKPPIKAFDNIVTLGLNDVLYNTKTGEVYTPNTDKTTNLKGGEVKNEDGN